MGDCIRSTCPPVSGQERKEPEGDNKGDEETATNDTKKHLFAVIGLFLQRDLQRKTADLPARAERKGPENKNGAVMDVSVVREGDVSG